MNIEDDLPIEITRKNLLNVYEEKSRAGEKAGILHRLIFIGKLRQENEDRKNIAKKIQDKIRILQQNRDTDQVSGLLLLYMKHLIHTVESCYENIKEVVQDLRANELSSTGYVSKVKLLVFSHDIPHRVFPQWTLHNLNIQAQNLESFSPSEKIEKVVVDLINQVLMLGCHLAQQPKAKLTRILDSLHLQNPELLPHQGAIHYLLEEDTNCISTPAEYLRTFEKPVEFNLDAETVWPMPVRLIPTS